MSECSESIGVKAIGTTCVSDELCLSKEEEGVRQSREIGKFVFMSHVRAL